MMGLLGIGAEARFLFDGNNGWKGCFAFFLSLHYPNTAKHNTPNCNRFVRWENLKAEGTCNCRKGERQESGCIISTLTVPGFEEIIQEFTRSGGPDDRK